MILHHYPRSLERWRTVAVALVAGAAVAAAVALSVTTGAIAAPTASTRAMFDPAMPGPGGVLHGPRTLVAKPTSSQDPFTVASDHVCYVGRTVPVACIGPLPFLNPAPERYISAIVTYSTQAGVDPRLVLTVLWNEDKHWHTLGGDLASAIVDKLQGKADGPSYGLADMKQDTFDQVQAAHPALFGHDQWTDLQNDPDLAVQTLAWKLHDIETGHGPDTLPGQWNSSFKRDEMLAMAYNKGAGDAVTYTDGGSLPSGVRTDLANYKSGVDQNWAQAGKEICQSTAFTCAD